MFEVKQFSSGEYEVKINERIYGDKTTIHWNWFNPSERDLMLLLIKISAIKKQYGDIPINVYAHYLPYARQDRVFEAGQDIAIETLIEAITGRYNNVNIVTMALHCINYYSFRVVNQKLSLRSLEGRHNIVFPDANANNHFWGVEKFISFTKERTENGVELKVKDQVSLPTNSINLAKNTFLICDDICAGGRTFSECANTLKQLYGESITIELMIYHAFLDHGLEKMKEAGITRIKIINPDSYKYICDLYPNDLDYFEYVKLKGN